VILLQALTVAFAAFCVWLTVRIVNRRERWAKWTLAAVVVLPVFYVASFGLACRSWSGQPVNTIRRVPWIYSPIAVLARRHPAPTQSAIEWCTAPSICILDTAIEDGGVVAYLVISKRN
jgi:hypothetical protein